ncbi:MAG: class I tRNA ligase family protein, partial [Geminicoccaceae bacterium]|nr:class I tRNA ligase family protein [Geminicoccaceae bacterium]
DWYVEMAKPAFSGEDEALKVETRSAAAWVLAKVLHLMHPIAPFVTEQLWKELFGREDMLIRAQWPELPAALVDAQAEAEMRWLIQVVGAIRAARSELNVPASAKLQLEAYGASARTGEWLRRHREALMRLARLEDIVEGAGSVPPNTLQVVVDETTFAMQVADFVDLAAERGRLQKEWGKVEADIMKIEKKLANESFLQRAPESVVEEQRERLESALQAKGRLEAAIERITF